jgi:hypothetical protein
MFGQIHGRGFGLVIVHPDVHASSSCTACSVGWWLVAGGWCWFVLREKYCWLVAGGWFVVREKYCWLVADKPSEQGGSCRGETEQSRALNWVRFETQF